VRRTPPDGRDESSRLEFATVDRDEPILAAPGVCAEIRRAILSHADVTGITRDSRMEKALYACDELAGFLTAAARVRPSKSIRPGGEISS